MKLNIVCPDIKKLDSRNKFNFNLNRCQERFKLRSDGCVKCIEGTYWFMEQIMRRTS